jgi:hypothetical protein
VRSAALCLLLAACGSSGIAPGGGDGGSGNDMSVGDLSTAAPPDLLPPVPCGKMPPCTGGTTCCVHQVGDGGTAACATTCPGGTLINCFGPEFCASANPCCMTITAGHADSILCTGSPGDCAPNLGAGGSGMTRICNADADCTAGGVTTNYPQCCHNTKTGLKLCFSSAAVPFSGGAIACP